MVQPATPTAVIFGRSVVERGQVTVGRHPSSLPLPRNPTARSIFVRIRRVGISAQQFLGVVGVVDLRRIVAVGPAKAPAVGDHGVPFAPARPAVVAAAGEKQLVRVGAAGSCPIRAMVNLAAIAGLEAIGPGAAAVAGVADESLVSGGKAFLAAQIQWSF